jgi:hypothetical protein
MTNPGMPATTPVLAVAVCLLRLYAPARRIGITGRYKVKLKIFEMKFHIVYK